MLRSAVTRNYLSKKLDAFILSLLKNEFRAIRWGQAGVPALPASCGSTLATDAGRRPRGRQQYCLPREVVQDEPRAVPGSASLMVPFRPSSKRSLNLAGVIDTVGIADERVGKAPEIEQAIPVGVVAGEAGDLETEYDPDVQAHVRREPREAAALDDAGAGKPEVFVDDDLHFFEV